MKRYANSHQPTASFFLHFFQICLFLLVPFTCLQSQTDTISLSQLISYFENSIESHDPDAVIEFANQGFEIAQIAGDKASADSLFFFVAKAYHLKNEIPQALKYYLLSLRIRQTLGEEEGLLPMYVEIAQLYENWGVHEKAAEHYLNAYEIAHEYGQDSLITLVGEGIARMNYAIGNKGSALNNYGRLQMHYAGLNDQKGVASALRQIVKIHKELENYQEALTSNHELLALSEKLQDTAGIIISHNNIGVLHRQLGN